MNERLLKLSQLGDTKALETLISEQRRNGLKEVKSFKDIESLVFYEITNIENEQLVFKSIDGRTFTLSHYQDCCENVYIADINGDLNDLLWVPIISAKEESFEPPEEDQVYDFTMYTFYHLRTKKGDVTIRWVGSSNGYYSVSVDFEESSVK